MAMMEKSRMYIYRGLQPEEPVISSGYLCEFKDLSLTVALLDDIFAAVPDPPSMVCYTHTHAHMHTHTHAHMHTCTHAHAHAHAHAHTLIHIDIYISCVCAHAQTHTRAHTHTHTHTHIMWVCMCVYRTAFCTWKPSRSGTRATFSKRFLFIECVLLL
jgi:hypothetical protein